jgi:hypothetical protein
MSSVFIWALLTLCPASTNGGSVTFEVTVPSRIRVFAAGTDLQDRYRMRLEVVLEKFRPSPDTGVVIGTIFLGSLKVLVPCGLFDVRTIAFPVESAPRPPFIERLRAGLHRQR